MTASVFSLGSLNLDNMNGFGWHKKTNPGDKPGVMVRQGPRGLQRIKRLTREAISSTPASGVLVRAKMALVVVRMMSDTWP